MRKRVKLFSQVIVLLSFPLVFGATLAATVAPITLSPAGATDYDVKNLNQVVTQAVKTKAYAVDVPLTLVSNDKMEKTPAVAHCQVFSKNLFDWFAGYTLRNNNQLYHHSILPEIVKTEQYLSKQHYPVSSIFLCTCAYSDSSKKGIMFPAKQGKKVNLVSSQNTSGQLVILTQPPNALVLFS